MTYKVTCSDWVVRDDYVSWMEDTEQALSIFLNKNAYRAKSLPCAS